MTLNVQCIPYDSAKSSLVLVLGANFIREITHYLACMIKFRLYMVEYRSVMIVQSFGKLIKLLEEHFATPGRRFDLMIHVQRIRVMIYVAYLFRSTTVNALLEGGDLLNLIVAIALGLLQVSIDSAVHGYTYCVILFPFDRTGDL